MISEDMEYASILDRGVTPQTKINVSAVLTTVEDSEQRAVVCKIAGVDLALYDEGEEGFFSEDGRYMLLEPMRPMRMAVEGGVEITVIVPYPPPKRETLCHTHWEVKDGEERPPTHVATGVCWGKSGWKPTCAAHGGSTYEAWPSEPPSPQEDEHEFEVV